MSFGIKIINPDTGNILIDENYQNQSLIKSGTIASLGSYTVPVFGGRLYKLQYPTGVTNPSIAIQLDKTVKVSRTSFLTTSSGVTTYIWVSGDPANLKYYLFGSNVKSNITFGLRVFSADGTKVCFDSGFPPLKILGVSANNYLTYTVNGVPATGVGSDSNTSQIFNSTKTLAIMITGDTTNTAYVALPSGLTGLVQTVQSSTLVGFYISLDNRVLQERYQYSTTINNVEVNSVNNHGYAPSLVLDVTNY